jgi:hypothetical protein
MAVLTSVLTLLWSLCLTFEARSMQGNTALVTSVRRLEEECIISRDLKGIVKVRGKCSTAFFWSFHVCVYCAV